MPDGAAEGGRYYLDDDGRVRASARGERAPFTGIATLFTGEIVEHAAGYRSVERINGCIDVAATFREHADLIPKHFWVLYCAADGTPTHIERVGLGGDDARWSARETLCHAVHQHVPRVSLISNTYRSLEPPQVDLEQRQMFAKAAAVLGITIDHQVFIGPDGFAELTDGGELVGHAWQDAARPSRKIPSIFGKVGRLVPEHPGLAAALAKAINSVDDAEAVARLLLRGDEPVALALLHATRGGQITGVFPIGSGESLDESSARLAFAAGLRGICDRVIILAGGVGAEWEERVETFLGPVLLDLIGETYVFASITVLVRPDGRRVWGELTGPRPAPRADVRVPWGEV